VNELTKLLHFLRDGLLLAIGALERGNEIEAAEQLESTLTEGRKRVEELRR
jgi:hypothetical protein